RTERTATMGRERETFVSGFGVVMTMIGAAVGLGAVWRFPYMVGRFGGAAFVLFYIAVVLFVGIPALMTEWALGRHTGRGPLGAYERGGLPGGRIVGGFLFAILLVAAGYYGNVVGWVLYHGIAEIAGGLGLRFDPALILPPGEGFKAASFIRQLVMTAIVIFTCGLVIARGLRKGIERASKWIVPAVFVILLVLILRSVTLDGAGEGLRWYLGGFRFKTLTPSVMAAAMGMAFFSMSLGGTFMVIYGSYLNKGSHIPRNALTTSLGASLAGVLAGLAIFPAVFSFGLEPTSGPGLIFETLPRVFDSMPAGWVFGFLFFIGLFGAAYLSEVAAFEVLVGGLVDNTRLERRRAGLIVCGAVWVLAIPPMINTKIFLPWDLFFGSGMQVLGSFLAVLTAAWFVKRAELLKELAEGGTRPFPRLLYWWIRLAIPAAILFVGVNWLLESL
ncbi:MAG: sodium-dependent transporter, partial [Candidatus Aminicenantes bacterium]|nr:sodium-dependent transporter [Candidatus Aminicenantes bacterium]